ncbi:MAG TPA: DUF4271 domain-containing protein [Saprospiraceae bacterium]|nr:DUF4271 domain-containing protein [Saprospiraceae bacterium]
MKDIIHISLLLLLFLVPAHTWSQEGNPFELEPRLPEQRDDDVAEEATGNPFDIVPGRRSNTRPAEPLPEIKPLVSDGKERFNFFITLVQLLLLASLVTLLRPILSQVLQAFLRDNLFNQLFRDRQGRGPFPFILLSILFYINVGWFIFHLLQEYKIDLPVGLVSQFGICVATVVMLLLLKYLLLLIIGYIFPVKEQIARYRFLITIFSIITGLALIPINLLLAYGPPTTGPTLIWIAIAVFAFIYIFRALRAILIANQKVSLFSFHFLLYICTIEIAPVLIFWKLISNQL